MDETHKLSFEEWERDSLLNSQGTPCSTSQWMGRKNRIFAVVVALLAACTLLFAWLATVLVWKSQQCEHPAPVSWLPPDMPSARIFHPESIFSSAPTEESKEAWMQIILRGKGFVKIDNLTQLEPMPGLDLSVKHQKAVVAVFHQLHCLYTLQQSYFDTRGETPDPMQQEHVAHCWDYVRQALICASDTTLEWVAAPPHDNGVSGWGYQHQCRDFNAVYAWTEKHRVTDNQ